MMGWLISCPPNSIYRKISKNFYYRPIYKICYRFLATEKITSPPPVEKSVKFNEGGNQPQVHPHVAPRKDWPHRIYFSNLSKPGHFVDFKAGQQELMKEVLGLYWVSI